jgi:hypothetical protein
MNFGPAEMDHPDALTYRRSATPYRYCGSGVAGRSSAWVLDAATIRYAGYLLFVA